MSQIGLCVLKLNLSGASIVLNFNQPKRMETYKNEKLNIFTYKKTNEPNSILQIYFEYFQKV